MAVSMTIHTEMARPILYLLGVVAFCVVYQLGGQMAHKSRQLAYAFAFRPEPSEKVRKFFQYMGVFIQVAAVGLGAMDAVRALLAAY